jgi:hypothetical protein
VRVKIAFDSEGLAFVSRSHDVGLPPRKNRMQLPHPSIVLDLANAVPFAEAEEMPDLVSTEKARGT